MDVTSKKDEFVHEKQQTARSIGEQLKDSPLQKSICFGSDAPAYAGSAIAKQVTCLPTSLVLKRTARTFRVLKRNVHALLA